VNKSRVISMLSLVVILLSIAATASASSSKNLRTHLNGDNERPTAVVTDAQGQAILQLSKDGTSLRFKLKVANIENVTQAHIHMGPATGTGGVVVWLYPDAPPAQLIPGPTNGMLAEGENTDAEVVGSLAGTGINGLLGAIEAGNTYVNVHTSANPPGEIRGQLHNHQP
jgi:hypothetical protein